MKFSELDIDQWAELQPYLDTCLLPVTGLTGAETPPAATERIAAAGDWLAPLEASFRGRTVTMPAYHYADPADEAEKARLERYLAAVKRTGFRYLVVVTGSEAIASAHLPSADLIIGPAESAGEPDREAIRRAVTGLWSGAGATS